MIEPQQQRIVKVPREKVEAAKALIRLRGGEDKVDPIIVKIANAEWPPIQTEPPSASSHQ